jgi:GNAT superfamily N-acetyltransferase
MIEIREQALTEELKKKIYDGFSRHAIQMTGHNEKFDAVAFVAMEGDSFVGAMVGERFWNALHVKYVYVDEQYRGKGMGTRLMQCVIAYGLEQKCPFAFVETMSFQALEFYQKMGFELDYTRSGYAHGTSFHYLSKKLIFSDDFNIRPLREQDIEALGDLYFPWSTREETVAKWTRYLDEQQQGARLACIVEQQGKIVGYGNLLLSSEYLHFRKNNIPEINDIWVYEENRKKGIATALIAHLEQLAKQNGYTAIGIGVGLYRDYGAAQRLYFRLSYKPDGEGITYNHTVVVPGEKYPIDDDLILWLTKQLSCT